MKKLVFLALIVCGLGIISCGPSKADLAKQEQALRDSIQRAVTDSIHLAIH